jgi:hypothetical protein
MKNEEMSDFSIQSPVKRSESSMKNSHLPKTVTKKLKFGSSKKGFELLLIVLPFLINGLNNFTLKFITR